MNGRHTVIAAALLFALACEARAEPPPSVRPRAWIGYTEFRTNLPGGRHANVATMRASLIRADGSGGHRVAGDLIENEDSWTQFAGFSPDGRTAIVGSGWESPENAAWEEEHRSFRFGDGWRIDGVLVDLASGKATNVTAVERVSLYNSGVFYWPGNERQLGFQALIGGVSHPFRMDLDGRNKRDLAKDAGFSYGFVASPDGRRIAFHGDYQIYLANADGNERTRIDTGQRFNFGPTWSPDGEWVLFLAGVHGNSHPYAVRADGSELHKLADRGGYAGAVEFLDVFDFHGGSSDVPVWSADGKWIYYTANAGEAVELFRVGLTGEPEQLTHSKRGVLHYHPQVSRDGQWLLFGSTRDGMRQLYVARPDASGAEPINKLATGHAAMWGHWGAEEP